MKTFIVNIEDDEINAETFGANIAQQCGWDGETIMKVFLAALTDANYHTMCSRLEDAYNNYLEEIE
jgi:hypothetical protein